MSWGYPFNRSKLDVWSSRALESTIRGLWVSSRRGSGPMRIASTIWTGSGWPEGFACLGCGHGERWSLSDRRIMCASCGGRTSVTAGTIFERTRTPLTVWFTAGWLFATGKDGISALSLQRTLEIGSYQTA